LSRRFPRSQEISPRFRPWQRLVPSYPRPCPRCGVLTADCDFGVDRSKASGRRSYCKVCDRRRGRAYYDAHKDELLAKRVTAREAAWQAELEAQAEESRKRVAAAKELHAAQVRRQKEVLRSIGVPDLSPEEVTEKARRCPSVGGPAPFLRFNRFR